MDLLQDISRVCSIVALCEMTSVIFKKFHVPGIKMTYLFVLFFITYSLNIFLNRIPRYFFIRMLVFVISLLLVPQIMIHWEFQFSFIENLDIDSGCFNAGFENISILDIAKLVQKKLPDSKLVIQEKINSYFGYSFIKNISILPNRFTAIKKVIIPC